MLEILSSKLKLLLKSPMAIFVYGIMSKWYVMVAISAIVVVFWVFKGLTDTGILQAAEKVVSNALQDTKSVARYCVPKILNLGDFWDCLQNPPSYTNTKEEDDIEASIKSSPYFEQYKESKDPYAQ